MMQMQAYPRELEGAVRDFNARLRAGGSEFHFHESSVPGWLPRRDGCPIFEEYFLAVDGAAVRGGYVLKRQPFHLDGRTQNVGNLNLTLSEGSINPVYNMLGVQILADAQKRSPLLYALGMGGFENTIARMLKAVGFSLCAVPFFFRVVRPGRFLRHFQPLRKSALARLVLDGLAASGLGTVARPLHAVLERPVPDRRSLEWEVVDAFGEWADGVWEEAKPHYSLIAVRDRESMNVLYPAANRRALRLKVVHQGEVAGWAVLLDTPMAAHKHFGAMRLGSLIDCLARPGREAAVAQAATAFLMGRGVDLIVTNQSHRAWGAACRRAGYLPGPSNFVFAASRKLAAQLTPFEEQSARMHLLRGDGEGPSHL
jgi:hypothetical protein